MKTLIFCVIAVAILACLPKAGFAQRHPAPRFSAANNASTNSNANVPITQPPVAISPQQQDAKASGSDYSNDDKSERQIQQEHEQALKAKEEYESNHPFLSFFHAAGQSLMRIVMRLSATSSSDGGSNSGARAGVRAGIRG